MSDEANRLEKILRGELAAVASYRRALEDLGPDDRARGTLRAILDDHREAVTMLQGRVTAAGGDPDQDPGPWGAFATAVESAGAAMGEHALLLALKEGEQHGVSEYRTALSSGDLSPEARAEVRDRLIPAQDAHIARIDELTKGSVAGT